MFPIFFPPSHHLPGFFGGHFHHGSPYPAQFEYPPPPSWTLRTDGIGLEVTSPAKTSCVTNLWCKISMNIYGWRCEKVPSGQILVIKVGLEVWWSLRIFVGIVDIWSWNSRSGVLLGDDSPKKALDHGYVLSKQVQHFQRKIMPLSLPKTKTGGKHEIDFELRDPFTSVWDIFRLLNSWSMAGRVSGYGWALCPQKPRSRGVVQLVQWFAMYSRGRPCIGWCGGGVYEMYWNVTYYISSRYSNMEKQHGKHWLTCTYLN